jgi:hypothetical protein
VNRCTVRGFGGRRSGKEGGQDLDERIYGLPRHVHGRPQHRLDVRDATHDVHRAQLHGTAGQAAERAPHRQYGIVKRVCVVPHRSRLHSDRQQRGHCPRSKQLVTHDRHGTGPVRAVGKKRRGSASQRTHRVVRPPDQGPNRRTVDAAVCLCKRGRSLQTPRSVHEVRQRVSAAGGARVHFADVQR